jgi:hypothetical protein
VNFQGEKSVPSLETFPAQVDVDQEENNAEQQNTVGVHLCVPPVQVVTLQIYMIDMNSVLWMC